MHRRDELGPKFSEGARLLWLALASRKWSPRDFARALDVSQGAAYRYLYGDRTPDRLHAQQIQKLLGISPDEFDRATTRKFTPHGARVRRSRSAAA